MTKNEHIKLKENKMKMEFKESKPKTEIPELPIKTYQAVISGLWDIGNQKTSWKGVETIKHQVMLRVEVNKKIEAEGDLNGKRYCLYSWVNIPDYFGDEANIVKIVSAAMPDTKVTKEFFATFDTDELIGKNINIATKLSGTGKAKVDTYSPLMEGMQDIKPELEPTMPEWVKDIADKAVTVGKESAFGMQPTGAPPEDDLLPF